MLSDKAPNQKQEKSHQYFKDTKVDTCSFVRVVNNTPQAIPYYQRPQQSYADKMNPSSQTESMTSHFHKIRPNMHLGMEQKPLVNYDPNSKRNNLPIEELPMPANNASKIVIGDRKNDRHYVSVSSNTYGNFGSIKLGSNSGINASLTRNHHGRQAK